MKNTIFEEIMHAIAHSLGLFRPRIDSLGQLVKEVAYFFACILLVGGEKMQVDLLRGGVG